MKTVARLVHVGGRVVPRSCSWLKQLYRASSVVGPVPPPRFGEGG